ncbi:MAG TPA: hypothetical protein VGK45_00685 [Thermoanaerobaculia bacterium]
MKTDRWLTRAAAVALAGLLMLAAGSPAAGQITFKYHLGKSTARESSTKELAMNLAAQMQAVQETFIKNRNLLHLMTVHGKSVYLHQEVAELIAHTGEDLDKAIDHVQPTEMAPLRAWAANAIQGVEDQLTPPGQTAAAFHGVSTPRAVAVVASLGGLSPSWLASVSAGPQQDTVPADTSNGLLDQVGNVISRIFFLASHDDLVVKVWVGSTAAHSTFSFWPQGRITGTTPAAKIIRTDGTQTVLRGLYAYKVTHTDGAVTEFVQFPNPAGASPAQTPSEQLDLVNGSSFFCCRFNESYCHHVDNSSDCQP